MLPPKTAASYARHATRYKVRQGDTVQTVADNFGLPPVMVRRWNHLRGDSLRGRRIVYIHLPVTPNALASDQAEETKSKFQEQLARGQPEVGAAPQSAAGRDFDLDRHHPPHHRRGPEAGQRQPGDAATGNDSGDPEVQ